MGTTAGARPQRQCSAPERRDGRKGGSANFQRSQAKAAERADWEGPEGRWVAAAARGLRLHRAHRGGDRG